MQYFLDHLVVSTPIDIFDSIKTKLPDLFNCVQYQHVKTATANWEGIYFMLGNHVYLELIREDLNHFPSQRIGVALSHLGKEPDDFIAQVKENIYRGQCKEEEFETDGVRWLQALINMEQAEVFKPFFLKYLGEKATMRASYNAENTDLERITEVIVRSKNWQKIKEEALSLSYQEESDYIRLDIPTLKDSVNCLFIEDEQESVEIRIKKNTVATFNFKGEGFSISSQGKQIVLVMKELLNEIK